MRHKSLTTLAFMALTAGPATAQDVATITRPAIAAAACPQEWSALRAMNPTAWDDTIPMEIDPTLSPATTEAFNKYVVAIMALSEYMTHFVGFMGAQSLTPTDIADARPHFDLAICLMPTAQDRTLILDMAFLISDRPSDEIAKAVFEAFDQFDCMRVADTSTALFALDPNSATFLADTQQTIEANMVACP